MGETRDRVIVITPQTILELLKDYCGGEIPADAKTTRFMLNQNEQGKFCLEFESKEVKSGMPALVANFDVRKNFVVG